MPTLFDPLELGDLTIRNRVIMAPLTRSRATSNSLPTPIMAEYYAQRASAGLIISEAVGISQHGNGFTYTPGLWSEAQVEAWKPVTGAVHEKGGLIVAQLGHTGRAGHPSVIGEQPISSSATTSPVDAWTYDGPKAAVQARAIGIEEIPRLIADFAQAAGNAIRAGFDGIQIHAANGMLIDQFLRDSANRRTDEYGGSIQSRVRLLKEVTEAVVQTVGKGRTSVRLSPNGETWGVDDSDPTPLFSVATAVLDTLGIAFLELKEPGPDSTYTPTEVPRQSPRLRPIFKGPLVLNADYDRYRAMTDMKGGLADAISFGRPFIANPDLPVRLRDDAPLNEAFRETFYTQGPEGYLDYTALADRMALA